MFILYRLLFKPKYDWRYVWKKDFILFIWVFAMLNQIKRNRYIWTELNSFCCHKENIYLSIDKNAYYEIVCLKSINYNIFNYSAYDWLIELIIIGLVFDWEVNKNNK